MSRTYSLLLKQLLPFRNVGTVASLYVFLAPGAFFFFFRDFPNFPAVAAAAANRIGGKKVTFHAGNVVLPLTGIWLDWQRLFWRAFVVVLLFSKEISRQNNPNLRRMKHKDVGWTRDLREWILKRSSFPVCIDTSVKQQHISWCFLLEIRIQLENGLKHNRDVISHLNMKQKKDGKLNSLHYSYTAW